MLLVANTYNPPCGTPTDCSSSQSPCLSLIRVRRECSLCMRRRSPLPHYFLVLSAGCAITCPGKEHFTTVPVLPNVYVPPLGHTGPCEGSPPNSAASVSASPGCPRAHSNFFRSIASRFAMHAGRDETTLGGRRFGIKNALPPTKQSTMINMPMVFALMDGEEWESQALRRGECSRKDLSWAVQNGRYRLGSTTRQGMDTFDKNSLGSHLAWSATKHRS